MKLDPQKERTENEPKNYFEEIIFEENFPKFIADSRYSNGINMKTTMQRYISINLQESQR